MLARLKTLKSVAALGVAAAVLGAYGNHMAGLIFPPARADCALLSSDQLPEVVIYGTSWCNFCTKTRWHLEDRGVAYCEYDIETSDVGAAGYCALNGKALPVVTVGEQRVNGFRPQLLDLALRQQRLL